MPTDADGKCPQRTSNLTLRKMHRREISHHISNPTNQDHHRELFRARLINHQQTKRKRRHLGYIVSDLKHVSVGGSNAWGYTKMKRNQGFIAPMHVASLIALPSTQPACELAQLLGGGKCTVETGSDSNPETEED